MQTNTHTHTHTHALSLSQSVSLTQSVSHSLTHTHRNAEQVCMRMRRTATCSAVQRTKTRVSVGKLEDSLGVVSSACIALCSTLYEDKARTGHSRAASPSTALAHAVRALRACFGKSLDVRSAQRNGSGDAGGAGRRRMETAANASQGAAPRD
jgi:hypothetical protein